MHKSFKSLASIACLTLIFACGKSSDRSATGKPTDATAYEDGLTKAGMDFRQSQDEKSKLKQWDLEFKDPSELGDYDAAIADFDGKIQALTDYSEDAEPKVKTPGLNSARFQELSQKTASVEQTKNSLVEKRAVFVANHEKAMAAEAKQKADTAEAKRKKEDEAKQIAAAKAVAAEAARIAKIDLEARLKIIAEQNKKHADEAANAALEAQKKAAAEAAERVATAKKAEEARLAKIAKEAKEAADKKAAEEKAAAVKKKAEQDKMDADKKVEDDRLAAEAATKKAEADRLQKIADDKAAAKKKAAEDRKARAEAIKQARTARIEHENALLGQYAEALGYASAFLMSPDGKYGQWLSPEGQVIHRELFETTAKNKTNGADAHYTFLGSLKGYIYSLSRMIKILDARVLDYEFDGNKAAADSVRDSIQTLKTRLSNLEAVEKEFDAISADEDRKDAAKAEDQ